MFKFTESIQIEAKTNAVWEHLADIEQWWLPSNPDHIRLEVPQQNGPIVEGSKVVFEERIAGIRGEAEGVITQWIPESQATWEGEAEYDYMGLHFQIHEGVSWQIEDRGEVSRLSAQVWALFPPDLLGRIIEWYAKSLLKVVKRDREHARRELIYLKHVIEDTDGER